MEFDIEAPSSASRKRGAGWWRSSLSCHISGLRVAGAVESTAFSGLSKLRASGSVLSARGLTLSTSVLPALKSSSLSRITGSSRPRQQKLAAYFHNSKCNVCAYQDFRLSYRFVLTCSGRQSPAVLLKLPRPLHLSCLGLDPSL